MNKKLKGCLILSLLFSTFFILAIRSCRNLDHEALIKQRERLIAVRHVQFKGKVIRSQSVAGFGNKGYFLICILLDYTNTDSFFIYNDNNFIKIKNGIASMSGGIDNGGAKIDYVEVNMHNNGKEKYYYKNGKTDEGPLSLSTGGVTESDLNTCN